MSTRIPESVRLKEKRDAILRAQQVAAALTSEDNKQSNQKEYIKRAEQYIKEYENIKKSEITKKREAHNKQVFLTEKGERLVLAVRIRGINGVPPKPKKTMELLRLLQINNCVFIRVNQSTEKMLQLISPYISYGYPSLSTVRNLIYKRGYCRINGQRVRLTSNEMIEEHLKKYNIICMEDLIHEIFTVGEHFKEANNFLWPFKLNAPTGGFRSVKKYFNEGGDLGNCEECINTLVNRMV